MTLIEIANEINRIGTYIGGNHYTPKEAEELLYKISKELCNTTLELSVKLDKLNESMTGVDDDYRKLYLRSRNIEENEKRYSLDKKIEAIEINMNSMRENAKLHERGVRQNGEMIAAGLQMALEILRDGLD